MLPPLFRRSTLLATRHCQIFLMPLLFSPFLHFLILSMFRYFRFADADYASFRFDYFLLFSLMMPFPSFSLMPADIHFFFLPLDYFVAAAFRLMLSVISFLSMPLYDIFAVDVDAMLSFSSLFSWYWCRYFFFDDAFSRLFSSHFFFISHCWCFADIIDARIFSDYFLRYAIALPLLFLRRRCAPIIFRLPLRFLMLRHY